MKDGELLFELQCSDPRFGGGWGQVGIRVSVAICFWYEPVYLFMSVSLRTFIITNMKALFLLSG